MNPEISLVIATYNRAGPIVRLLGWLQAQTMPTSNWEVLVVVDGSTDDTVARLDEFKKHTKLPLHVFVQANAGPAAARHNGILHAGGKRIVIIDDDMEPVPDFLKAHLTAGGSGDKVIVIGHILPTANWATKPLHDAYGEANRSVLHDQYRQGKKAIAPSQMATGNVSFPRQFYLDVEGFDLSLRVYEDADLGIRFGRAGATFVFSDAASAVHHSDVGNFDSWKNRQYRYGNAVIQVWQKHGQVNALHPLRDYVFGSRLNHLVVNLCTPSDGVTKMAVARLRDIGSLLQTIGLLRAAIATHNAIRTLEFHRAVRDSIGGWPAFQAEAARIKHDSSAI